MQLLQRGRRYVAPSPTPSMTRYFIRDAARLTARNAPLMVAAAKLAIECSQADEAEKDISAVEKALAACFASEDYRKRRRALLERRSPSFLGR